VTSETLENQRVVVIGGTSGIGFAVAQQALAAGARVFVGSSDVRKVDSAIARLTAAASGWAVDVRDEASLAGFFDRVGTFEHLVFTAGDWGAIRAPSTVRELDLATAHAVFAVRFWGALAAVKHAQGRISTEGSITLTDGLVAHRPRKGAAINTAMAGAIEHLTRSLAVDLAPLRINAVCPGYVLTEVWDGLAEAGRGPGGGRRGLPLSDAGRLHDRPGADRRRRHVAGVNPDEVR
jgi:NAD(P)-dependent dehydrogenase (short-subunit alcohol dehydrogenase family)